MKMSERNLLLGYLHTIQMFIKTATENEITELFDFVPIDSDLYTADMLSLIEIKVKQIIIMRSEMKTKEEIADSIGWTVVNHILKNNKSRKKNINEDGGKHCLTCKGFTNFMMINHKLWCSVLKERVPAGSCSKYEMNTDKYFEEIGNDEGIEIHTLKDHRNDLYHQLFNNERPTIISTEKEVKSLCEIQDKYRELNDKLCDKLECSKKITKGDNKKCH